jgi:hypothetical protein
MTFQGRLYNLQCVKSSNLIQWGVVRMFFYVWTESVYFMCLDSVALSYYNDGTRQAVYV